MKNHRASVETFLSVSPTLCHYICFARSHVPITPSRSMYGNCSVLLLRAGTDRFTIEAGGPSPRLSPLFVIIIMDVLPNLLGSKPSESMLFSDDIVRCEASAEKVEHVL